MKLPIVTVLLLSLGSGSAPLAAQACPVQGLVTRSVGEGTGPFGPSGLSLAFDAGTCSLDVEVDAFTCCNVFLIQHLVVLSPGPLREPVLIGGDFLPGSLLFLREFRVLGPFPGASSSLPLPPSLDLVGATFSVQAVPVFFLTIGLRTFQGITQGVEATFL